MDPQPPMPSALQSFEHILSHAKGKKIALFLDYDGTLSPIVDDPDRAFMSNSMRAVVKDVAQYFPTSIISGRSRDKVYEFIGLEELHYAGSHGMDIMTVNKEGEKDQTAIFQPACKFLPMIQAAYESFVERTKRFGGAKVEDNKFCVSVHYRNAEKDIDAIRQCVDDTLKEYPELKLTYGKKVFEIRPVFDWNKGKALEFLLEKLELSDRENVLPIYVGDDKTDEDAFKVLKERGQGYGILVSSVPKDTNAFFSLKDPDEVREFLSRLSKYGKEKQ